jgi:hypothetical protein
LYSTCLFCNNSLGSNEAVEQFPVGRRLAFDQRRGRLWVVCRNCEKWNLTPLEERWDAIERCEQLFRDTRKRISTDNIGLARLPEGLELVRIGEPQRPEFATWRYGDQFGRRYRRSLVVFAGSMAMTVGVLAMRHSGMAGSALAVVGTWAAVANSWGQVIAQHRRRRRMLARIHLPTGDRLALKPSERFRLVPDSGSEGWALDVHHIGGAQVLTGDAALRALTQVMAHMNHEGGSRKHIAAAVNQIESTGDSHKLFRWVAQQPDRQKPNWWREGTGDGVHNLPSEIRLAMEMSANEENERIALEGELSLLEDAWKEAEEIAAIADNLALPRSVESGLLVLQRKRSGKT